MSFKKELLDELLKNYKKPEDLFGEEGTFKQLKKALVERMLEAELSHHLGYEKHEQSKSSGNYRNGKTTKRLLMNEGELEIEVPRDRMSNFEPKLIAKHQRRLPGFDDKILSLYARGMTVREIQSHIEEIYQTEVSHDLISTITDEVMSEVDAWQSRPLDQIYPILYLDAIVLKVRDNGQVKNKALYLAIGITMEGNKEILGMWISVNEGAKFWLSVVNELKNRGVQDIFIACVDGLKGFPDAINTVFPQTQIQLCIVHMIRNSLNYVPWKDRKRVAADLRSIYTACNEKEATRALNSFREQWDKAYPTIAAMWERNWANIIPFLEYPDYIRKVIYTTNTVESINYGIRKVTKNRTIFPDDKAAFKLVYLALHNLAKNWNRPIFNWKDALNQFAIMFGERVTKTY
ncbi:MAG: IS256 family transposase [Gammaproteobacteria bacterium]|nr:IS256 family transposase [Gammaproteobacteria bacterium]